MNPKGECWEAFAAGLVTHESHLIYSSGCRNEGRAGESARLWHASESHNKKLLTIHAPSPVLSFCHEIISFCRYFGFGSIKFETGVKKTVPGSSRKHTNGTTFEQCCCKDAFLNYETADSYRDTFWNGETADAYRDAVLNCKTAASLVF